MLNFDDDRMTYDDERILEDEVFEETSTLNEQDYINEELSDAHAKRLRGCTLYYRVASAITAFLFVLNAYMVFGTYNPKERDFSEENIYAGNELVVSDDDVDKMISGIEEELGVKIADEDYDTYCLLNAILENENLSDEEKEVFYRVDKVIKDNPYINKEAAYKSLLNVDVSYKKRPLVFDKTTEGVYSSEYESIGIFVKDPEYRVLLHEIIHCIFDNEKTAFLPQYFKEGMTELLANEYFSDNPFLEAVNYPFEISVIKMLCEVSSPDAVLEAYSTGNMSVIAKEIAKISHDFDGAMEALDNVDTLMRQHNEEVPVEEMVDTNTLLNGFIPLFRAVVEAKYEVEDHARVSYFYNEILMANILDEKPYDKYVDDIVEFGLDNKAYFSSELKEKIVNNGQIKKIKSTIN